jgi:hypothetical protein
MRNLPYIICFVLIIAFNAIAQSDHGEDFDYDCELCHEPVDWNVIPEQITFDHDAKFELIGQHKSLDCRSCHVSLEFSKVESNCISCHTDLHQGTVGKECSKCHASKSWMVEDINGLHQRGRFPLLGNHLIADCAQCHTRYIDLYFELLDVDCIACHSEDYYSTQNPNHVSAGFSTDCQDCHSITASEWSATNIVHDFFPLIGGHAISDCFACHEQGGNFVGLSSECITCHQDDYNAAQDPNHAAGNFPTDCKQCHTITAWIPATIDHNQTAFPLTGKHINIDCSDCHESGFTGTPTDCYACHQIDYETVQDPNHVAGGYSTDCTECHTTNGWDDIGNFNHNITQFPLTGAHISTDCSNCHQQGYSNTPIECIGCHEQEYNNSTNPNHISAGFPTTCEDCHETTAWTPATFDHDGQYFPIYSGKHVGEWNQCVDCHEVPNNYSVFTCISCHEHNQQEMDDKHQGISGYIYASEECFACHPTGEKGNAFDHTNSNFPLTGAHISLDCQQCHESGYSGTQTECFACHENHFNNSTNPNHTQLGLPTECETCHTTDPNWKPALFPQHNQYFELLGRHLEIATDCDACHSGNYMTTPNICFDCHTDAYDNATNPNHQTAGISTECEQCHNSAAWIPSNFNHTSATGFELLGAHSSIQCSDCHQGTTGGLNTDCIFCHQDDFNSAVNHVAQGYPTECEMCHNSTAWNQVSFNHANTNFPLLGAHQNVNCSDCHESGFTGTTTDCFDCHQTEFNATNDPPHQLLNFSHDCLECHNMNGWIPANFNHSFYPVDNRHDELNCNECHSEPNYQPQCIGCHLEDFLEEHNPGDPTDCWSCHNAHDWSIGAPKVIKMQEAH